MATYTSKNGRLSLTRREEEEDENAVVSRYGKLTLTRNEPKTEQKKEEAATRKVAATPTAEDVRAVGQSIIGRGGIQAVMKDDETTQSTGGTLRDLLQALQKAGEARNRALAAMDEEYKAASHGMTQGFLNNLSRNTQMAVADYQTARTELEQAQAEARLQSRADLAKQQAENERAMLIAANEQRQPQSMVESMRRQVQKTDDYDWSGTDAAHVLPYLMGETAQGAAGQVWNLGGGLTQSLGDLLGRGRASDALGKVQSYFDENPQAYREFKAVATNYPEARSAVLAGIAKNAGVSTSDLENYRQANLAQIDRENMQNTYDVSEGVREVFGNMAYQAGQQIPAMMLTAGGGSSALVNNVARSLMGMSSYGAKLQENAERNGYDWGNYANAAATGLVESMTEAIGSTPTLQSIAKLSLAENSVGEMMEELIGYPLEQISDWIFLKDGARSGQKFEEIFDAGEWIKAGVSGAVLGGLLGSVGSVANIAGRTMDGKISTRQAAAELNRVTATLPDSTTIGTLDPRVATEEDLRRYSERILDSVIAQAERAYAAPKMGSELAGDMGIGKNGAQMAQELRITPENVGAFTAYYNAGAEGRPIESVSTKQRGLDAVQAQRAYVSGQMDATEDGVAGREWTTYNRQEETNGRENDLRQGGQRYDGQNSVQPVRGMEESAGRNQSGYVQARPEESRVVGLEYSAQKVNSRQAGLEDGLEDDGIYLIRGGTNQDYRDAEAEAKRLGLEFVPFAGGDIHTADAPDGARGVVVNGRMFVRMDDPDFTGRQIALHEGGHELIRTGKIDVRKVLDTVAKKMEPGFVQRMSATYTQAYAGAEMTDEQIMAEMVCDARGEMNIFKPYGEVYRSEIDLADQVLPMIREEAELGGGTRAGPDGAQYSRYVYPKLKQGEWDLLNQSLTAEISKPDGYLDEETKWLYKNEKGESVFSVYGIGDGTDPTPLYASGGKQAEADYARMMKHTEGYEHVNTGRRDLDRVLKNIRSKQSDAGAGIRDVAGRGANAADVRVPVGERAGDGRADSGAGEADQREVNKVGVSVDQKTESASPAEYSRRTWLKSQYSTDKAAAAKALSRQLDVSQQKAEQYIDDVNSVAKMIADDAVRLDYEAAPGMSSFVGNSEYGGSIDFSTICKKRRLLTGTFEAIQKALPNTALTAEEVLTIRKMMADRGYEVSCGLCYVEGSRANMGQYTKQFLEEYAKTNPKYLPNMAQMNTASGQEQIRIQHPEVYAAYEKFMNSLAQRKPKMYQMATEYQGEILKKFNGKKNVAEKNKNGGLRLQSFSDFEIIHLIDSMQVIMDMSQVGLAGQAYTKVPDFAAALGDTGLKINLSLIAKGVDAKGNLVLDEVEGMPRADAEKLRNQYSDNVGTVIVVFTDVQLQAAMKDPFIDYIIPFHRSQWNSQQYELMGLPKYAKDCTSWQNESFIEPVLNKNGKKLRPGNYMPNEYWDFSKSGTENAKKYLQMCHENNRRPKFHYLLDKNANGSYSLKKDGSTDGYWKLLIDFKMYNNEGVGVEQTPVRPEFNMAEAERMLREYQGGHETFPAARDVVDEFVEGYKKQNPRANYSRRLDSDYMKAVQNGDMETAQRMVDEAAEAAGYTPVYRYHQTGNRFNTFSNENPDAGLNDSDTPNGYFFKENDHDIGVGADFVKTGHGGSIQMKVFLKHRNMLRFENRAAAQKWYAQNVPGYAAALAKYEKHLEDFDTISRETNGKMFDELNELDKSGNSTPERDLEIMEKYDKILDDWIAENESYSTGLRAEMRKLLNQYFIENDSGYDGIELVDDGHRYIDMKREDVHTFIVFQNSQIKSADPVTYDDNGNVIPLSKRFDPDEVDIRLSRRLDPEQVRRALDQMREQYGVIEPGENPAREIQMPRKTGENENVSKTVRTVLEAKATPEAAIPTVEQMVANGDFSYETITDKAALAQANSKLQNKGWARTLSDWLGEAKKGTVSKDHTVTGWALYNNAANAGDLDTAMTVLEEMVKSQRNAAQALQATRVLKKMSPEAQLYGAQRSIENLQEELNERYGKKDAPEIRIDPTLAEEFLTAKTEKARADAMANIYKDVGKQMPSTFRDKWNAWRYLAMLGNPRTHVRNIVGNAGFAPVVAAKNLTATAIEKAVNAVTGGKTGRSKAVLSVKDADLLKAAWADFENVQDQIMAGGKYSDFQMTQSAIEEGRRIFKNRLLEGARRGNSAALEAEDVWFSKPHYATALASYCKANKISPEKIAEGTAIETARAYAIREAQKATYRDTNAFSQMISDLGKVDKNEKNLAKKGVGLVLQGILPFRKTPANILVRGVEYSPIGLLKSITVDSKKVANGEMSATDLIDNISAGLTGTGLLAMGAFLAAQGLVRGHGPEDKEKEFEEMQGHQAYSLEVGGKSYTLDWLAPECLPFFVGVNLYEQSVAQREDITMSEVLSAITNVSEPMLEMSCLQSLNDVFDAVGYASSNDLSALPSILASAATSYLTQAIPTILGQAERTGQDVRYSTYTTKDAFLTRDMQYAIGSATARIPGIDYNQVPYIDAWGRQEGTGTVAERAAGNFLNPSYTSNIEESAMEKELLRVYGETGEASVFPTRAQRSFPVNGETKYLTADEYVKYATSKGQTSHELVEDLVNMSQYKAMSEEEKASAISDAYSLANVVAKYEVSDYTTDGWMAKAVEAKKIGIDYSKYLEVRLSVKDIESIKDADGDSIANSKGLLVMEAIYNIKGLNDKQRRRLFEDFGVGKSVINLNKAAVQAKLKGMR